MRVNDFKINEDAKMAKATDEKIIALLMQFSKMDLSSPANEFMFKRVRKEFKKRNISLSPEQMKSFIGAQRSIDKVKIGEDEGDMGDEDFRDGHDLGLLKQVSAQIAQDAVDNDYTAIDELLKNVTTSEMQGFLSEMESTVEETEVAEAVKGPGVDAINDLLDMGVSKEDLFDQMMRDHSDDELMSFADDYRRMNDMGSDIDPDDDDEASARFWNTKTPELDKLYAAERARRLAARTNPEKGRGIRGNY